MNNEYKPVLICNGNEHDLKNHGELICGGCGYQYSSDEANAMFKDVKIKVADTCGMEVRTKPLRCIRCCRRYESVYFSELGEVSRIIPLSMFQNRYVTKYGELILPKTFEAPLFIPSWDFNKQRRMSIADAIAYMLYSSLAPLGYTSSDAELRVRSEYWELFFIGAPISPYLHNDICSISKKSLRCCLNEFDKILASMHDMENDRFFSIGGNEDD